MKIFLTGGGGFLGGNILREIPPEAEVISLDTREQITSKENCTCITLDLTDTESLLDVLAQSNPDVVIHTAAISDIDYCEANRDIAKKVNIGATRIIVDFCRKNDTKMIHFSSDSVFDGEKGGYAEEDIPKPLHYYGTTKVTGEKYVTQGLRKWNIIRPSLIMGLPVNNFGNSFLWRMIKDIKKGNTLAFPEEEIRSPVDAVTLSRAVLELSTSGITGIFHLAGNTRLSRFEMAKRICRFLSYSEELVIPKNPVIATGRASRPADVTLDNTKAIRKLKTPMLSLEEGLELVMKNKGEIEV